MSQPSHIPKSDFQIMCGEEYKLWTWHFTTFDYLFLLHTLCSEILNLFLSL